ncbi:MAG TPA: nicotinate-nucleotide diphosphorylase (carboxylating), partial [Verrucomicrobiales bacterium]|nr:nicotinate-nucleotide diphosphorylase (carboxylating) [Verrucomicrobiales bacterium]
MARAKVVAREDMVLCGMSFMEEAFLQVDGQILWKPTAKDGMRL